MQRSCEKSILDFILEKEIPFDRIEDVFYELYLINPHSSDVALKELTVYPESFFHSMNAYKSMVTEFEEILKCKDKFILQKRFRACLALIYLEGMSENGFKGSKNLLKIEDNREPFKLALDVFHSENNFKSSFSEVNSMLSQKDGINALEMIQSI